MQLQVKIEKSKNAFCCFVFTAFMMLGSGHILVATLLLKNGANVNAKASDGTTPMSLAKAKGHARMVELLEANGAK